jgi:hypothetical protein
MGEQLSEVLFERKIERDFNIQSSKQGIDAVEAKWIRIWERKADRLKTRPAWTLAALDRRMRVLNHIAKCLRQNHQLKCQSLSIVKS